METPQDMPKNSPKWIRKDGEGRWENWVNTDTGEETVKTHVLKKISNWDTCDHYFEIEDRTVVCNKCGIGKMFNPAIQEVKDGKLINK